MNCNVNGGDYTEKIKAKLGLSDAQIQKLKAIADKLGAIVKATKSEIVSGKVVSTSSTSESVQSPTAVAEVVVGSGKPKKHPYVAMMLDAINKQHSITIKKDIAMAVKILQSKGHSEVGRANKNEITLPDFEGVIANEGAIRAVSKVTGQTKEEVVALANEYAADMFMERAKLHESIHVASVGYMEKNPNSLYTKRVETIYRRVLEITAKDSNHPLNFIQNKYWATNVKEFLAVSLSHSEMIKELNKITIGNTSIFHVLIDTVRKMLKIPNNSATGVLMDSFLHMNDNNVGGSEKPAAAIAPTTPVDAVEGSYVIPGVGTTNAGQTKAVNEIANWLKERTQKNVGSYLLTGSGGTGKTAVVNVVLSKMGISPKDVVFVAPTNRAKTVLNQANSKTAYNNSEYATVAQLQGLLPDVMTGKFNISVGKEDLRDMYGNKLLVIDESSMIGTEAYSAIIDLYGAENILFMGDIKQLPPIEKIRRFIANLSKGGYIDAFESPVFTYHKEEGKNVSTLTQIQRQSSDNPINNITSFIGDLVLEVIGMRENDKYVSGGSIGTWIRKVKDGLADISKENKDSRLSFVKTKAEAIKPLIEAFKEDKFNTAYIHFNNAVHDNTIGPSNIIRNSLFGEKAAKDERNYIEGDLIVFKNATILYKKDNIDTAVSVSHSALGTEVNITAANVIDVDDKTAVDVTANSRGIIRKIMPIEEYIETKGLNAKDFGVYGTEQTPNGKATTLVMDESAVPENKKKFLGALRKSLAVMVVEIDDGFKEGQGNREVIMVTSRTLPRGEVIDYGKRVDNAYVHKNSHYAGTSLASIRREHIENSNYEAFQRRKQVTEAYKSTAFITDIKHGYVVNSHQVQGSSYGTTVVDVNNIIASAKFGHFETMLKALYVAVSRPKSNLILITDSAVTSSNYADEKIAMDETRNTIEESTVDDEELGIPNKGPSQEGLDGYYSLVERNPDVYNQIINDNNC